MNSVYRPSDDTYLLADTVKGIEGYRALEIGTGSGYIAGILADRFKYVIATDIDLKALFYARYSNGRGGYRGGYMSDGNNYGSNYSNSDSNNIEYLCCNAADALRAEFDLIVINPPYLPSDEIDDPAVDGGEYGIEIAINMLRSAIRVLAYNGSIYMLLSSLARYDILIEYANELGLHVSIVSNKSLWFEELIVIRVTKSN